MPPFITLPVAHYPGRRRVYSPAAYTDSAKHLQNLRVSQRDSRKQTSVKETKAEKTHPQDASHPNDVDPFHTTWVKWPVSSLYPGFDQSYLDISLYQPSTAPAVPVDCPPIRFSPTPSPLAWIIAPQPRRELSCWAFDAREASQQRLPAWCIVR